MAMLNNDSLTYKKKNIDPYDLAAQNWITDPDALPPLTYPDIVNDLVFELSVYTV